jgi:hypothetical protein
VVIHMARYYIINNYILMSSTCNKPRKRVLKLIEKTNQKHTSNVYDEQQ